MKKIILLFYCSLVSIATFGQSVTISPTSNTFIKINNDGAAYQKFYFNDVYKAFIGNYTADDFYLSTYNNPTGKLLLATNSSPRMTILADGKIGIGTTTPGFLLNFPNAVGDKISLWGNTGNHYGFGIQGSLLQVHSDISSSDIAFGYGTSAAFTERMRIKGNGKVGIGTTIPTGKLHIEHSGTDTDPHIRIHSTGSYSRINWSTNTNANTWTAQSYLESATAASNYWRLEYGSSSKFYVAGNGNVGIGTETPDNKLDVLGIIRANEVIVETGWADYVFKDDYQLKPLSEVEAFIKENKHLPSVPSAATIQDKGAHVAELMTKMMEKIEELTLYSIQQKKEIDELKKRLDDQK